MSQNPITANSRANVALALTAIIKDNRTIDWVLDHKEKWSTTPLEREMLYGCVRHYSALKAVIDTFVDKPLRNKDLDLLHLMLVGAYQLLSLGIPAHAVINETVSGTKKLGKPWAKGLVNAVLRNIDRDDIDLEKLDQSFGYPKWLAAQLAAQYPANRQAVLATGSLRAPMSLRINASKLDPKHYHQKLQDQGIAFDHGYLSVSVCLKSPLPSIRLPGWLEGEVAVQDMGAQFAADLLHKAQGRLPKERARLRILDACAAPGGKLAHLLEIAAAQPGKPVDVTAIDVSQPRIKSTNDILTRLGHQTRLTQGDATNLDWWDGAPFDQILLDAPCSGTGTLRRHPDIRLLITEHSVQQNITLQKKIINNLWQTLAPGGNLLYCTCSLLAAENDGVIRHFLDRNQDASAQDLTLPSGEKTQLGWQLLPTDPLTDGFYYALLQKAF